MAAMLEMFHLPLSKAACHAVRLAVAVGSMTFALPVLAGDYAGSDSCASCHQEVYEAWRGSHHDLAMAEAREDSILGDFDDVVFSHDGHRTTFYRDGDAYMVRTEGPDGETKDFTVAYTFGAAPLQQYLIEMEGGRYQALTIAWDNRAEDEGGQRWFDLLPDIDPAPGDPDHWTGRHYNWNSRCASCHSTGLIKGYEPATRTYATTFEAIDVACESCHGAGADHIAWAKQESQQTICNKGLSVLLGGDRGGWTFDENAAIAHWQGEARPSLELDTCAPCHSRRQALTSRPVAGEAFLDHYLPATLDLGLYHADGQIDDEVFVWGSFVQSKMHQAGVICSDCHDPHSLETKAPGNDLCAQCHRPKVFDTVDHHRHETGSKGALCVSCHMPAKTYMVIDPRRDHGFRVPRPDLAETLGVPDACTGCHQDQEPTWAASALDDWLTPAWRDRPSFARTLDAGRQYDAAATPDLLSIARDQTIAPIVRATALSYLSGYPNAVLGTDLSREPSALIRLGAARAPFSQVTADEPALPEALLTDPVLAVRLEAARSLAGLPEGALSEKADAALQATEDQLIDALKATADWPETQMMLGDFHNVVGRPDLAENAYREALILDPRLTEATVNLATLLQQTGREGDALTLLRRAVSEAPEDDTVRFALGLAYVRRGDPTTALAHLRNAAELAPEIAQYAYAYGIGLHSTGQLRQAFDVLEAAVAQHPSDQDLLYALATMERDRGNMAKALAYAMTLKEAAPQHPYADALLQSLQITTRQ